MYYFEKNYNSRYAVIIETFKTDLTSRDDNSYNIFYSKDGKRSFISKYAVDEAIEEGYSFRRDYTLKLLTEDEYFMRQVK